MARGGLEECWKLDHLEFLKSRLEKRQPRNIGKGVAEGMKGLN